ncbi:GNAT family N-acetyltransferase [Paenibacillus kandeliae]|uniref:GNAT family N-acetyltransferase n=1 Tax=Paenibacillus kandeliae TaxID=3231269 RepID=UPI00345B4C0C
MKEETHPIHNTNDASRNKIIDYSYRLEQHCPTFVYSVQYQLWEGSVEAVSSEDCKQIPFDFNPYYVQSSTNQSELKLFSHQLSIQLVSASLGWHHISGKPDREFLRRKFEQSWQYDMHNGKKFLLFSSDADWDECIEAVTPIPLTALRRIPFYYQQTDTQRSMPSLPVGYSLEKINAAVIQKSSAYDENYIKTYWGSVENYLQHGFGYAIWYEEEPVCACISIIANDICAEIDIETHKDHRGKGLAQIVAHAFIQECIRRGLYPRWDCLADNDASRKLALKLGFIEGTPYHMWTKAY